MKTRRARKAAKDPNNDVDPDDQHLETLISALQDGDKSLGQLRRDHGLAPEAVMRLMAKYPKLLGECPVTETIRLKPGIITTRSKATKATQARAKAARKAHLRRKLKPGQPANRSKLNDEMQKKICNFIAGGMLFEDACRLSGIHRATMWEWRDKGAAGEPRYKEFLEAVELASLTAKAAMIHKLRSDPDWRATKFILMNRHPQEFRERIAQEVSGPDGTPIQTVGTINPFRVEFVLPPSDGKEFVVVDHSTNGSNGR